MPRLSVNVNKVALLRNQRDRNVPDVVRVARQALEAGANGITVHPRPDGRHVRNADVVALRDLVREYPDAELNVEGNPFESGWMDLVREVVPEQATLVPDAPGQVTSDHGFTGDDTDRLEVVVEDLRAIGCRVSVFVDPDPRAVVAMSRCRADRVELYTGPYADRWLSGDGHAAADYTQCSHAAHAQGLGLNAGHDLDVDNLPDFLAAVPRVLEVSIGHALIARSLEVGITRTVREYLAVCAEAAPGPPSGPPPDSYT